MARKKHVDEGSSSEWLNTYADMVTLLLTFFVLLYSMSTVSAEKFKLLVSAMSNIGIDNSQIVISPDLMEEGSNKAGNTGTGIGDKDEAQPSDVPIDVAMLYDFISEYVANNTQGEMKDSIEVKKGKNYVFIRFTDNVFFNADSAALREEGKEVLKNIGAGIKSAEAAIGVIRIEGHTAAVLEDENYRVDDRELSSDRANSVLKYLQTTNSISPEKLSSMGYGKYRPIADNATVEGRKKNRRVEILIVEKDIDIENHDSLKELVNIFFGEDKYTLDEDYIP